MTCNMWPDCFPKKLWEWNLGTMTDMQILENQCWRRERGGRPGQDMPLPVL
jgi:hypothetical protein